MTQGYLTVDGGGTSSEFVLKDEAGVELLRFTVGSTSKKSIGAEGAQANISLGVRKLLDYLESDDCPVAHVEGLWGLSGCDSASDQAEYQRMLEKAGLDLAYHQVMNDALLTLRQVAQGPGIVLVSGTGSICIGVNAAGETYRIGGWGYQVSDLGSGTWVGSRLLQEALLFDDGCRQDDPVFAAVYQQAGCAPGELGPVVADFTGANQFAAFARLALEATDSPLCDKIADEAAAYLAGYIKSVAQRLFGDEPYELVLAGGLLQSVAFSARVRAAL